MIEGKKSVVLSYQLLGEAILFFMLGYPLLQKYTEGTPFRTYMIIVLVGLSVYFIMRSWNKGFLPYLSVFITILGLALFLNIHLILTILIGLFLVWRLYVHEQDSDLNNEQFLLISTTILSFILLIFYREIVLIFTLLLLYALIWGGNATSHYLQVESAKRRGALKSLFILWSILIAGAGGILAVIPFLRNVVGIAWTSITYGFMVGVNGVLSLLAIIGLDVSKIESVDESEFPNLKNSPTEKTLDQQALDEYDPEKAQQVADSIETGGVLIIVLLIPFVLFIIYRLRKSFKPNQEKETEQLSYQYFSHEKKEQGLSLSSLRFQRSNSEGAIRKHFQSFERFAARNGHGRFVQEPLDEWFARVRLDVKLTHLYQKVRYGNKSLSAEEKQQFYRETKKLKQQITMRKK